ncbi:DNA topoisomerase (ATP-hydrolyzing) subunit A [Helicobacter pylori]
MQDNLINETKNIVEVGIDSSIEESYLAYSMSVIIGRALPDARDGLKPVHRRILYAMHELGLTSKVAYKKSARIVGDVIGKYHPHGDNAVYDALVRMAQDFSMRLELVDGQGNFGSIDGDNAAAMRYTEARMTKASEEILRDIDKDTIDFVPNYDDTLKEPDILPSRLPNLLVNGANGIAVGMATSIPPHRIDEIIDALVHVLENPNAGLDEILEFVKGPDFPTGGIIYGKAGIIEAYKMGRGRVKVRAKVHVEKTKNKEIIVLDEMPFQTNKAKLVEQISDLVREKKQIEGISEVRDESDREGIRVVIELKKDAMSEIVLNHLYKLTTMETTFSIILLAIYNKEPKIFTLLELLRLFLNHRKTIIIRRTIFELEKAKARAHILEGYLIALDNIDEIVQLIKTSQSPEAAKNALMERFTLSEIQSKAILEMRLQRLTGLERDKIKEEYQNLLELISDLNGILKSEDRLNEVVKIELLEVKEQFSSQRRTEIQEAYENIDIEDLIANEPMVVSMSYKGYVKRVDLKAYERQNRGGKGKLSGNTYEDDFIENFFVANTHDILLFITNKGQLYHLKVYKIPEASRIAMGKAVVNLISLDPDEKIMATLSTKDFSDERSLAFFTKKGVVKRTNLSEFGSNRSYSGIRAIVLDEGDELVSAKIVDKNAKHLLIASYLGIFIKFPLEDVREIGRTTRGVIGIRLNENDFVVGAVVISDDGNKLLSVSENGLGKQTLAEAYREQSRGGKGIIGMKLTQKTGNLVSVISVDDENLDLMILTASAKMIRVSIKDIKETIGRNTSGVKLIDTADKVVYANSCPKEEEPENLENSPTPLFE